MIDNNASLLFLMVGIVAAITLGLIMYWLGRKSLADKASMCEQLQTQIKTLEQSLADAKAQQARYESDIDSLSSQLSSHKHLQEQTLNLERAHAQLLEKTQQLPVLQERVEQKETQIERLAHQNSQYQASIAELNTRLDEERKSGEEKLRLLEDARGQLTTEFQNLANAIFEEKTKRFADSSQSQLTSLLNPLREQIGDFKKKVEDVYDKESKDRSTLITELKHLKDLNQQISQDAINLTNALKGENKTQGVWGEMVLEKVLEQSGLVKGREYETQTSLKDESGGRFQPDVIIRLPEDKDIVVDSKVSLTAFERFYASSDSDEKLRSVKQHCQSLRGHVKGLSEKNYENLQGIRSLDFVLLFIPIEAAFVLAVENDRSLFADAFEKNIIIVSPTTLLATLRTIANIWKVERQNQNAQEIALRAGQMYDKFVRMIEDMDKLGVHLERTTKSYDDIKKHLSEGRGNLISRTDALRELGAKNSKSLPDAWKQKTLSEDSVDLE